MRSFKLFGQKAAYDEIITTAVKRHHEPQRITADLKAPSIKYRMTSAKTPPISTGDAEADNRSGCAGPPVRGVASEDGIVRLQTRGLIPTTGAAGVTSPVNRPAHCCSPGTGRQKFFRASRTSSRRPASPRPRAALAERSRPRLSFRSAFRQFHSTELGTPCVEGNVGDTTLHHSSRIESRGRCSPQRARHRSRWP